MGTHIVDALLSTLQSKLIQEINFAKLKRKFEFENNSQIIRSLSVARISRVFEISGFLLQQKSFFFFQLYLQAGLSASAWA